MRPNLNLHTFPFIILQQHIMKRIFLFSFVLLSTLLRVEATAQDPDYLIYKGDTLRLYANPLEGYFEHLTRPDSLFPYTNTANARGYVAYWAIENDSLFLVDIKVEKWNNWLRCNRMVSLDKSLIFHNRKNTDRIFAEWVTDELLSPAGELLHYEHFGYEQEYSIERYFNIAKGILKSVREENNSKESFLSFMDIDSYISRYIEYNINYDNLSYIPNYPMQFMGFTYLDSMHSPKIEILPYDADSTILREIERVAENFHFLYDTFLKRHTRNLCFSIKIGPEARDAQMYPIMVPTLYSEQEIQTAEDHLNDLPYYYYRLASGYMKLTQKLYNDTPVQHQYDTLLLQMYDGDSTVLWQYRYRHFPDSALKYKKLSYLQPSKHIYDQMGKFYEIQQLEHYLGIPHDTTIHPVFDTVFQKYFQYDCGSILPKGWEDNLNVNIEEEKQRFPIHWGTCLQQFKEEPLADKALSDNQEAWRFLWIRPNNNIVLVRVDFDGKEATLNWKVATQVYDNGFCHKWEPDSIVRSGTHTLSSKEWQRLSALAQQADFDKTHCNACNNIADRTFFGIEHRTAYQFNTCAMDTRMDMYNVPAALVNLGLEFVKLTGAGIPLDY